MGNRLKECRCGRRILDDWPECHECLTQGVALRGERRAARLQRIMPLKRHMDTHHVLRDMLSTHRSDPGNQARKILATRAAGKKRQADRAGEALKQWMAGEA